MVRNVGHTSVEDNKKKAKGLKIFQILPSKGMNVAIEGMGSKAEIRFFCVKNCFIRLSVWYLFIIAFSCTKFNEKLFLFSKGHPLIHFMFYRDHGHGNQSVLKWAFLKKF